MNEKSMEQIYKEHSKSVYRYLFSLTHSEDMAEELTQETFYRAIKSIKSFDGSCKISVWLCQVAKHILYQEFEKKKKNTGQSLHDDIPSLKGTPEDKMILASEKMELFKAIHLLQEPMREVVYMRLSGEFSFAEIAEILEKNENWARVTFYRAKQIIKEGKENDKM